MHLPSLTVGFLVGALAATGALLVAAPYPDLPGGAAPVAPTVTAVQEPSTSPVDHPAVASEHGLSLREPVPGSEPEVSDADDAKSGRPPTRKSSITWSPLQRYRELCADPPPEKGPWVEVAWGLTEIGANEERSDCWWQAYRRDPGDRQARTFLADRQDLWASLILDELRRFRCGFNERSAMEADLIALFGPAGRLPEACDALRVDDFVARLERKASLAWHDLQKATSWRALAACDPNLWESLLMEALSSEQSSVKQAALERLAPVWVEQGRTADLQNLVDDPEISKRHRWTIQK
ncbi:MAG: hypothetical protein AAGG01_16810, partial [Planctomycetota bacterium]